MLKIGYLTINMEQGGVLKGPSVYKLAPDTIEVLEMRHQVRQEYNAQNGTLNGDRKHEPLVIVKSIDMTSPMLNAMCTRGDHITDMKLQYFIQVGNAPDPVPFYTWTLNDAYVHFVRPIPSRMLGAEFETQYDMLEEVGFVYQKITWEHHQHRAPVGIKDLPQAIQMDSWAKI